MRRLCLTLACLATSLCLPSWAAAGDVDVAQQIVDVMQRSGALENYDICVRVEGRTAHLRGTVKNEQQMATAVKIARGSPNIDRVINEIQIEGNNEAETRFEELKPAGKTASLTEQDEEAPIAAKALATVPPSRMANAAKSPAPVVGNRIMQTSGRMPVPMGQSMAGPPPGRLAQAPPARMLNRAGSAVAAPRQMVEGNGMPQPAFVPGTAPGQRAAYDQPSLPGYAWPTYAAYPNYAALTYPKQYSATAWPYIGPFYPYPQVPLGWRKVTLQWDDGWWFLDFKD